MMEKGLRVQERAARGRWRAGTVVSVDPCGWPRCTFEECVTVRFDDRSTTENREAARLVVSDPGV